MFSYVSTTTDTLVPIFAQTNLARMNREHTSELINRHRVPVADMRFRALRNLASDERNQGIDLSFCCLGERRLMCACATFETWASLRCCAEAAEYDQETPFPSNCGTSASGLQRRTNETISDIGQLNATTILIETERVCGSSYRKDVHSVNSMYLQSPQ